MSRPRTAHQGAWRHYGGRPFVSLVVLLVALLAPAHPAAPSHAAPAADPGPPQFLRDHPDLRGRIEDADSWLVSGGFLYWGSCRDTGPRLRNAEPGARPAAFTGYLRRWPLGGGLVVTLSDQPFCAPLNTHWAADASGLYYWANGYIYRRALSNPLVAVAVESTAQPSGRLVIDGDHIYWLVGQTIYRVLKTATFDPDPRYEGPVDYIGETGTNPHDLVVGGDYVYWFGDGKLHYMGKNCYGQCTRVPLANEEGQYLTNARKEGPQLGSSVYPLWVNGSNIRGYWCRYESGNISPTCSASTSYTAPTVDGNVYRPGRLATDGTYLFWVENYQITQCGPIGCAQYPSQQGRLMKWNLDQSFTSDNPFDDPQPIACQNCFASYSISNDGAQIGVAGGWVYFDTSNGIARVRADAPPIAWDLAFSGWEVTQAIQNLANDVPLVANKPTYVRLYGRKLSGPNIYAVGARLYGSTTGGAPLPGAPLHPINGGQNFVNNDTPNRAQSDAGWLFELPEEWTNAGSIKLSLLIDPRRIVNDPDRTNNALADQTFSFTRKAPICIVTIPVRSHAPAASSHDPSLFRMVDVMKRLMPASDVWIYHQDTDVAQLEAHLGLPPWTYEPYAIPEDGSKVLNALDLRSKLTDDPDRCDDAGAITHYVGLVHAQTPTNDGGGENYGLGSRPGDELYIKLVDPAFFGAVDRNEQRFNTLTHEIAHNYGRQHVNCGGATGTDPNYPYLDGSGNACVLDNRGPGTTTYFGFDTSDLKPISPTLAMDFMGYGDPYWVSDYTWRALFNGINSTANAVRPEAARAELATSAVVYLSGSVTPSQNQGHLDYAWTFPQATLSQGMRSKLYSSIAPRFTPASTAELSAGNYHVRLLDANNNVLDDRTVSPQPAEDGQSQALGFDLTLPAPTTAVARIELLDGDAVLASLAPGASMPTINVVTPAGGENFDDRMTLSWRASDPDSGDKLLFSVQYSPDAGRTWRSLLTNFPNLAGSDTVTVNLDSISGLPASTAGGIIRVAASDGYNTAFASSQPFTVPNRAPHPYIISPGIGQSIPAGQPVILRGLANDAEDGGLSGEALRWSLDGTEIGVGQEQTIAGLAPGSYTVTLTARDSAGREQSVSATLTIEALPIPHTNPPALDGECNDDAYSIATQLQLKPYADGAQATVRLIRSDSHLWACFSNMARTGGSSPGSMAVVRVDTNHSRDTLPQPGDYLFALSEGSVPTTYNGTGTGYTAEGPGGLNGAVSANETAWSAELQIDANVLGGWNHVVGLEVDQAWLNAVGDDYAWPHNAGWSNPSTWAIAALGEVPRLTALEPAAATAGGDAFTLTVNGSNFREGAIVRWNGVDRPTTAVNGTQLQATISAADIASPGAAVVTVVNPGMEGAPSNSLPFFITTPAPNLDTGRQLFLPLVAR